jgi:hypothetical protein
VGQRRSHLQDFAYANRQRDNYFAKPDPNSDSHPDSDADSHTDPDPNAGAEPDSHSNPDPGSIADSDANPHAYSNPDSKSNPDSDSDADNNGLLGNNILRFQFGQRQQQRHFNKFALEDHCTRRGFRAESQARRLRPLSARRQLV